MGCENAQETEVADIAVLENALVVSQVADRCVGGSTHNEVEELNRRPFLFLLNWDRPFNSGAKGDEGARTQINST